MGERKEMGFFVVGVPFFKFLPLWFLLKLVNVTRGGDYFSVDSI